MSADEKNELAPSWLDRFVSFVSPSAGLNRARARIATRALYEAGEPSRLRRPRQKGGDANVSTQRGAVNIRELARDMDENFDIAVGVLDCLVNNVVGRGIRPQPQIMKKNGEPQKELNAQIAELFADWVKIPEVTWTWNYWNLQRMIARTWFRDGECFAQLITGTLPTLDHGTLIPFSIEALEPDFCPFDYTDSALSIAQGIALNAWRRPRGFWMFKEHPGSMLGAITGTRLDLKFVPAEVMIHLKMTHRLHQLRGVSVFRAVMNRFDDVKDIDESERIAARVAAAMAAYVKKGEAADYDTTQTGKADPRNIELSPGMVIDTLKPGEEIGTIASNRPNNALIEFRRDQMRAVSSGTQASASTIARNYDGSYSSQRQELVEAKTPYDTLTDLFIDQCAQVIWEHAIDAMRAARLIVVPADTNMRTLYAATHSRPAMPWIDPYKETQAYALMEDRGYTSRSEIVRSVRGRQPDEVLREIKQDRAEEADLGVELDRSGGKTQPAQSTPNDNGDDGNDGQGKRVSVPRGGGK
jgi:lambda family phage portal protein